MAWIESHQEISRHPKTRRLARGLLASVPAAVGHLHLLWHWCLDYAPDGDLSRFSPEEIADAMMWEEDPQTLIDELVIAGFVDTDCHKMMVVHDWDKYGGRLLTMRKKNAEKQKQWREENITKTTKPMLRKIG